MMKSNFKFMRDRHPDLAENGANLERLCDGPEDDALTLLRKFGERLLQLFIMEKGGEVHMSDRPKDGQTKRFSELVLDCAERSKPWHIKEPDRSHFFSELITAGNRAAHRRQDRVTFSARRLLRVVWEFACWVWKELGWADVRDEFIDPPKGGPEIDDLRTQFNETLILLGKTKRQKEEAERREKEAERPCDLGRWICDDQLTFSAPTNFVGREFVFRAIGKFLEQSTHRVFLIEGQPGRGKTGLIKKFISDQIPTGITPFVFCFNDQMSQGEPKRWVRHLYASLLQRWELKENDRSIESADQEDLVQRLRKRLLEIAKSHPGERLLFVIDAVDEAGPAEKTVVSFLQSDLPDTVQVIATARPGHVSHRSARYGEDQSTIQPFNLEEPGLRSKHHADARRYVKSIMPRIADDAIREVLQLGDGNFLFLREICFGLREVPESGITNHLRELTSRKGIGKNFGTVLYERTWQRLERLDADSLDTVHRVARLLAVARAPLSERLIRDTLNLRPADWIKLRQPFDEYLVESHRNPPFIAKAVDTNDSPAIDDEDSQPVSVFRLFHETFEVFVRQHLKTDLGESKTQLAHYCREQLRKKTDTYESAYAIRFAVQHLIEAERWEALVEVLSDLDFIEARFVAGQEYDLLDDYDLALRSHPETRGEFLRRDQQDERLRQWVEDLVQYSRDCTRIREAHARGEIADPVAEIQKKSFPKPIDTSSTIEDMKKAELATSRTTTRNGESESVLRLREFWWFVKSQFNVLREVPRTTTVVAANFTATGPVTEAARSKTKDELKEKVSLVRGIPIERPRPDSLVLRPFDDDLKPDGDDDHWCAMTPDARIGYGDVLSGGRIWNLKTGRLLCQYPQYSSVLDVTPDGLFAVVAEKPPNNESSRAVCLVEIATGRDMAETVWQNPGSDFEGMLKVTPDRSRVIYVEQPASNSKRFTLIVWDTASNKTHAIDIGNQEPSGTLICASGMIAVIQTKNRKSPDDPCWMFFDLVTFKRIRRVRVSKLRRFLSDCWFQQDFFLTARLNWWCCTSDEKLNVEHAGYVGLGHSVTIRQTTDNNAVRHFSSNFPFRAIEAISADGRYALATTKTAFCLLDLANGTLQPGAQVTVDSKTELKVEPFDIVPVTFDARAESALPRELKLSLDASPAGNLVGLLPKANLIPVLEASMELPTESTSPRNRPLVLWIVPTGKVVHKSRDGTLPALLSPDGRFLVSSHRSTSGWDTESYCSQPISAVVTDLTTGHEIPIEGHRAEEQQRRDDVLGFSRDAASILFLGRGNDQLRLWNLKTNDWRTPLKLGGVNSLPFHMALEADDEPFISPVTQSPDGRWLLMGYFGEVLVRLNRPMGTDSTHSTILRTTLWSHYFQSAAFSPDGKFLIAGYQSGDAEEIGAVCLWEVETGNCLGIIDTPANPTSVDCDGIARDKNGRDIGCRIVGPQLGPAWVTAVRLFRFHATDNLRAESQPSSWGDSISQALGRFDGEITFRCRRCGVRSPLSPSVKNAIDSILRNSGLTDTASPVLELPDSAWDAESGLDFECPNPECHQPHRSTPFYVDRRR